MADNNSYDLPIAENTLNKWQHLIDVAARLINVPAGLIMRALESDIEVFVSSNSANNPYQLGDSEHLIGSGLYCETVINTQQQLLIPDALADDDWKENPDIKLNMISYLGLPLRMPEGPPFGTICVLDNKHNAYNQDYIDLLTSFRELIENDLSLCYLNQSLGEKYQSALDTYQEIKTLRGLLPICSYCKNVRDEQGYWNHLEEYIESRTEAQFSHGICDTCMDQLYGDKPWYKVKKP